MTQLQRYDFDSLSRALIGFDSMFDAIDRKFANSLGTNYPPYNVLKHDENDYEIQVAMTGFEKSEINVEVEQNTLTVKAEKLNVVNEEGEEDKGPAYLHRGLATRDFTRQFTLAEHMEVVGAEIKNGMLLVKLHRNIPESAKPRVVDIVEVK
jgi:molecular chaperone IbpA